MDGIHHFEFILLLLLLLLIAFGTAAKRLGTPYPIILVIAGLLISFVPHVPRFTLDPDLVFLVILPPLLFSAAYNSSWRDFKRDLPGILFLAFILVAITTVTVAVVAHWLIPEFDWRLGLVLGAILSPTDAVAATSIAKSLSLPTRITDLLEGESLVNDASGLLALEFAVAIVVTGQNPSLGEGLWRLFALIAGGIMVGLIVGRLVYIFETWVDDAPIEVTASFVTPYLAYLGGEAVHASGVLAAVVAGMYLGRRSSIYLSSAARIQAAATWNTLTFVLNGLAFLLIGLQLPSILGAINSVSKAQLLFDSGVVVVSVIVVRLVWVYPGAWGTDFFARSLSRIPIAPSPPQSVFIIGWTGMRGVVSLAAAFSLPVTISTGAPFPQRNIILFITFAVIFVTLVLQGLTLPSLIRYLGVSKKTEASSEEQTARRQILRRALQELDRMRENDDDNAEGVYSNVAQQYRARLANIEAKEEGDEDSDQFRLDYVRYRDLTRKLRQIERSMAVQLRDENKINDEALRRIERELDLLDARFAGKK